MNDTPQPPPASFIAQLRDVIPSRPLGAQEAYILAERQAMQTLRTLQVEQPSVPMGWVVNLSKVEVRLEPRYRMVGLAGLTTWRQGRYLTIINRNDAPGRRRFTLAHELKHILDYTRADMLYSRLGRGDEGQRARAVEQVADHFAACLLMPRPWLKRSWGAGLQTADSLASLFDVTPRAMEVRLTYLGFLDDENRPPATYFRRHPLGGLA